MIARTYLVLALAQTLDDISKILGWHHGLGILTRPTASSAVNRDEHGLACDSVGDVSEDPSPVGAIGAQPSV